MKTFPLLSNHQQQMTFIPLALLLLLTGLSLGLGATYPNSPDSDPPSQWSSMSSTFQQHCSPFGISIFSLPSNIFPRDKFLHVCNMMAQFLDNDQDGCADVVNVVKMMRLNQVGLLLIDAENEAYFNNVAEDFEEEELFASQVRPSCSGSSETSTCKDKAIEEVLNVITEYGVSLYYPDEFGQCYDGNFQQRSDLQVQMDIARGGHFTSTPTSYPADAIFTYYDTSCNYDCMSEEFFYYSLTSLLGGQGKQHVQLLLNFLWYKLSYFVFCHLLGIKMQEFHITWMSGKLLPHRIFRVNFLACMIS
jgi:hypothetical protein